MINGFEVEEGALTHPAVQDAPESEPGPTPEYVIDKMLDHLLAGSEEEFLVKWYGYTDPPWEPKASLPPTITSRNIIGLPTEPAKPTYVAARRRRASPRGHKPSAVRRSARIRAQRSS